MRTVILALLIAKACAAQSIDRRDQEFWNGKFNDPKTQFLREASPLLVDWLKDRKPGDALDLGMGEGRNAIYMARQGWRVTGVDLSDAAIAQAREHAAKLKANLTTVLDDLDHYDFGKDRWDCITLFYLHAWYQHAKPAARLAAALKPGGILIIEGFAVRENYMYQPNELLQDFPGLRVLRYEDMDGEAEWAPGKTSRVIRFVGQKP